MEYFYEIDHRYFFFYDGRRILLLLPSFSVSSVIRCSDFTDVEGDVEDSGESVGEGVSFNGVDVTAAGEVK